MAKISPLNSTPNSTPSSPEIPPPNELIAQLLEALKTARRLLSQVDPGDPALDGCYTEIDAAEIDDAIDAAVIAPKLLTTDEAKAYASFELANGFAAGYDKGSKEADEDAFNAGWEMGRKEASKEDTFDDHIKTLVPRLEILERERAHGTFKTNKEG